MGEETGKGPGGLGVVEVLWATWTLTLPIWLALQG